MSLDGASIRRKILATSHNELISMLSDLKGIIQDEVKRKNLMVICVAAVVEGVNLIAGRLEHFLVELNLISHKSIVDSSGNLNISALAYLGHLFLLANDYPFSDYMKRTFGGENVWKFDMDMIKAGDPLQAQVFQNFIDEHSINLDAATFVAKRIASVGDIDDEQIARILAVGRLVEDLSPDVSVPHEDMETDIIQDGQLSKYFDH